MNEKACPRCKRTGGARDDGYHVLCVLMDENDALRVENGRLRLALGPIAEGCGHARCHAYPWIRDAREALAD